MTISRIRAGSAKQRKPRTPVSTRRRTRDRPRDDNLSLETLTAAAIYDIQLHTQPLYIGDDGKAIRGSALALAKKNSQDIRRLIQPWQAQSMSYYSLVPEVKFGTNFFAQMLRNVRLFPAKLDPKTHEPEEIHDGPAFEIFNQIVDPGGGRTLLQDQYAKLRFLIGESYLTVSPDEDRGEVWECLSPNELRPQPGGLASRFRAPMLSADQYTIGVNEYIVGNDPAQIEANGDVLGPQFVENGPDIINVYRLWRPSPAYSWLADCNMQAALDILDELVLSTYSVRAQLKSRLYQAGIFAYPEEATLPSLGNDPEEDPASDDLMARLNVAIMASLRDPGTAAAVSPIGLRMAGDFIDKMKYIRFNDNQGELAEISQRAEMIGRFATCIELPKEVITGTADVNHWGAWLIDKQTYDSYGKPGALEMAADFTAAYLQPALRGEGVADWDQYLIGVDPSDVINHPDRAKDAKDLRAAGLINDEVYRELLGFNENDAMSDIEYQHWAGIALKDPSYFAYGIPSVRANIEPAPGDIESATGEVAGTNVNPVEANPGPPQDTPADQNGSDGGPALQASAALGREQRILGAADYAILRGREMAGARLRSLTGPRAGKCDECQEAIVDVPNWLVAATLGKERAKPYLNTSGPGTTGNGNLVAGVADAFAAVVAGMGVAPAWASELGRLVEQHAAKTLFQETPDPLPAGFSVLLQRIDRPLERS